MSEIQCTAIFEKNLEHLSKMDSELAKRLREVDAAEVSFSESRSGVVTGSVEFNGRVLSIASKYDPVSEGKKLADTVDYGKSAGVVVLGMGLGYHVIEMVQKLRRDSILVVHEPDLEMMRAVFERVDHSKWLGRRDVILADGEMNRAGLLKRLEHFGGLLTQGVVLVTHPPSRQLHGEKLNEFGELVTDVMNYCRTQMATALVNSSRTVSNLVMNLAYYHAGQTSEDLYKVARGYPAVCVSAGPSLAKNIDLLSDPQVRKKVVVITAQTTLKPLLDRGIRPDFVTALDYSEISKRFYEGLEELPDVTLVAQPLAHPAILDNFPGPIRVTNNSFLDKVIGPDARELTAIQNGSTVAHLSFYVAQHLGCDPIIMIGQDLGFSEGLYYCPGTAIHDVWGPELGAFNTLEMMEWQRIVRHRNSLEKHDDVHGRVIYSDEQMVTYLKQFERDFLAAAQTVIDATEGGLVKENTLQMSLAEAIEKYATEDVVDLPKADGILDKQKITEALATLKRRVKDISELRQVTQQTVPILEQMIRHQSNKKKMEGLFKKLKVKQKRVSELRAAFSMVNELNTIGVYNRLRADRTIEHDQDDQLARQKQQLERDMDNLDWLGQGCAETLIIFREGVRRLQEFEAKCGEVVAAGGGD